MTETFNPPVINSRHAWIARLPRSRKPMVPKRIILHHSWIPEIKGWEGVYTIQGIQDYHMDANKWADIGYHFVIGPDGSVWAGRDPGVEGAHCGGTPPVGVKRVFGNKGSVGICVIGNFDTEQPTQAAINALLTLITWLQKRYNILTNMLYGHCEAWSVAPKICPGVNLFVPILGTPRWNAIRW